VSRRRDADERGLAHRRRRAARQAGARLKLVNETRGAVLAERAEVAERAWARIKGLLGREALGAGEALVIRPCTSIHTFFMRFPIDVLFLDAGGSVLRAIGAMRPFRL